MSRTNELTKNTFIITIGRISTQFILFLLLPLYTTFLSTEEYGAVDLITTLVQLLVPVTTIMIDQGVFRYLLTCEDENEKKRIISNAFFILVVTSSVSIGIYSIIGFFVAIPHKLWLLLIIIVTAFSHLFLQIARGLRHICEYAVGSFVCSVSTIIFNILCIVYLEMGATGMLIATFIGNMICCVFLFIKLRMVEFISFSQIRKGIAFEEIKYSLPLVPNQLSLWVMNSSDRLIVSFILGTSANGILAVSHKFPTIYMTFFNIFLLAWHETGAVHYFDLDRDEFFTDTIKKVFSFFASLCMCVLVVLPFIFEWIVKGDFVEAYYSIPIYLVAFLFNVVIGVLGVIYVATKKTTEIAKTTVISAIINIVVHLALIGHIGLYAAAISTFISYFVTMLYRIVDAKRYLNITYGVRRFMGIGGAVIICSVVYYINNKFISLVFLPAFCVIAYLLNREIIKAVIKCIDEKLKGKVHRITVFLVIVAFSSTILIIFGGIVYNKVVSTPKEIHAICNGEIKEVSSERIIYFEDFETTDIVCTGITFDTKENGYWIADCGLQEGNNENLPRLILVDAYFTKVISEIILGDIVNNDANLQGIAYDSHDDCIWLAVGDEVIEISKDGRKVHAFSLEEYKKYGANGLAYDKNNGTLWVLCATRYLLNYDTNGNIIREYRFNYEAQDHLYQYGDYLFITVGNDYNGENNYVCRVSVDGEKSDLYKVKDSYSVEGIVIQDGFVVIVNDGVYHSDKFGCNYVTRYELRDFL